MAFDAIPKFEIKPHLAVANNELIDSYTEIEIETRHNRWFVVWALEPEPLYNSHAFYYVPLILIISV